MPLSGVVGFISPFFERGCAVYEELRAYVFENVRGALGSYLSMDDDEILLESMLVADLHLTDPRDLRAVLLDINVRIGGKGLPRDLFPGKGDWLRDRESPEEKGWHGFTWGLTDVWGVVTMDGAGQFAQFPQYDHLRLKIGLSLEDSMTVEMIVLFFENRLQGR